MVGRIQDEIDRVVAGLTQRERDHFDRKFARVIINRRAVQRFPTPGHLRQLWWPEYLHTPMLDRLDRALMLAESGEARRWVINCPPQEGKTSEVMAGIGWMLLRNPRLRVAIASYEQGVAARSGLEIRQMIETHGSGYRGQAPNPERVDSLGLMLDPDRSQRADWRFADVPGQKSARPGGVISVGVGSALTGTPVDVMIIDDPIKDAKQADSPVIRDAAVNWLQSVAFTRLTQNAIVIIVQTRWHELDPSGWVLAEDKYRAQPAWNHLNIPAQAVGDDDPLGRRPGEYLASARGRTAADWEAKKTDVGTRWWHAMYQGAPTAPEGGIFQRSWFDRHRVHATEVPELVQVITMVDPADNDGKGKDGKGKGNAGDESGIITAGLGRDGDVYILADDSAHYTVAGWVRRALYSMLEHDAGRLCYESSLSGLRRSIRTEWKAILRQAKVLKSERDLWMRDREWPTAPTDVVLDAAVDAISVPEDSPDEVMAIRAELLKLWPFVPRVLSLPVTGPPVRAIPARGSKSTRASLISAVYEAGRVHHVGVLAAAEHQMATWIVTQDSPDRMDAVVHAVNVLSSSATQGSSVGSATRRTGSVSLPRASENRR
jgi:hypothetical protein